jgi:hypothetical protein
LSVLRETFKVPREFTEFKASSNRLRISHVITGMEISRKLDINLLALKNTKNLMGLIIFLSIAVVSALLWHRFLPSYAMASIGATATTVVAFQIAAYFNLGYLDTFFLIAVVTSSLYAAAISFIVGIPFRVRRKKGGPSGKAL